MAQSVRRRGGRVIAAAALCATLVGSAAVGSMPDGASASTRPASNAVRAAATAASATRPSATRTGVIAAAVAYGRANDLTTGIAVRDLHTGQTYGSPLARAPFASESVVKVLIATRLLLSGRMHGSTSRRAFYMITHSDDGIASSLYGSVGGDSLLPWVARHYHLSDLGSAPRHSGWWGNTHITPDGMVRLYAKVQQDRKVGPWLINAMHHAAHFGSDGTYQFFGLPSASQHAAVKQGWGCDFTSGCAESDFNTTGYVDGDRYAVAILARGPLGYYGSEMGNLLTRMAQLLLPGGRFPDPAPDVRSFSPGAGRATGGTEVVIRGANLAHTTGVYFGRSRATNVRASDSTVRVVAPRHTQGAVTLRVVTASGADSATGRFTYWAPPAVSSVSPASGTPDGGDTITVSGARFRQVRAIYVGGVPATKIAVLSPSRVTLRVPAHGAGTANIRVVTDFGTSPIVASDVYRYVTPAAPTVTGIEPTEGSIAGGTVVQVDGSGFTAGSTVHFGDAAATSVQVVSSTQLQATTPSATAPGPVPVTVTTAQGSAPSPEGFTYTP